MIIHYLNIFDFYVSLEYLNFISILFLLLIILILCFVEKPYLISFIGISTTTILLFFYMYLFYHIDCSIYTLYSTGAQGTYNKLFYLDELSILFALMTTFIIPLCIVYSIRTTTISIKIMVILLLLLELIVLFCFTTRNLLLFFISFEFVIVPMMLLILNFGSRGRKLYAFISFFLYTFFGSIFLLIGIFLIYNNLGTLNFDLFTIQQIDFKFNQLCILICFLIGFSIKIPTMPMHVWLPEAHVEAPTVGSVVLASLLLKLGGYGIIRVVLPLTSSVLMQIRIVPIIFCVISSIYATFLAFRHYDTKKIIAYSSIAHMNLSVIGLFMESKTCFVGAMLSMLSHSLISSALFFISGFLYEKNHTRNVLYYSSYYSSLYFLYFFIFFFIFANMSFPGICSFIGELYIYIGIAKINIYLLIITSTIMFFTGLFSCVILYRIVYYNSDKHTVLFKHSLHKLINITAFNFIQNRECLSTFNISEFIILFILYLSSILLFFFPDLFIGTITNISFFIIY